MKLIIHKNGKVYKFNGLIYKELKSSVSKNNYPKINFYKGVGAQPVCHLVHRLLAKGYIKNPQNKPCINHKNGIKTDNSLNNLEWVTFKENTIHSFESGLQKRGHRGGGIYREKLRDKYIWRAEILHCGKKYKKKSMSRETVEIWLNDKVKELN